MANQPTKYSKFLVGAASAALVASAVAPVVASAADFSDVKGNTHAEGINALADAGIIKGYQDGSFKPNKTLSRSDVVKMMGKWLVTEGATIPEDARTNPRFSDLTTSSNGELLDYAAVVKDAGVFIGSNGRLLAADNITRENMALVLVRAFDQVHEIDLVTYVNGQDFKADVTDLKSAKTEAQAAINVLDFYDITNPAAPNFNPKGSTTRGHFATFLNKFINTDFSDVTGAVVADGSVKAINATTVEVTFKEAVENVSGFTIEGLTVSNAAVKQTDNKVVVLTTTAQEGGKKYEVKLNDKALGSFEGISSVIPTKIDFAKHSTQGKVGQQVVLTADVGVKQAGIPVTFNVDALGTSLNKDQVFEVVTNADGIATFSYTQYAAGNDHVVAYPTGAPSVRTDGYVFWGVDISLAVTEVTTGANINNGANKTYKVTYLSPTTGKPVANKRLVVSFEENINVNVNQLSNAKVNNINPAQLLNGTAPTAPVIITNAKGEATFTVTGENTAVTPIVFEQQVVSNSVSNTNYTLEYAEAALQVSAAKVTFGAVQADYVIELTRDGQSEAAIGVENGRKYKVLVKDKDGKVAKNETINVALDENLDGVIATHTEAKFIKKDDNDNKSYIGDQITVVTDSKGEASFIIGSNKVNDYGTPVAWIDVNSANAKEGKLDQGEPSTKGEISYFAEAKLSGASLTTYAGTKKTENIDASQPATFKVSLTNQSGTAITLGSVGYNDIRASFTVYNTGANDVIVAGQTISPNRSYTISATKKADGTYNDSIEVTAVDGKSTAVKVVANGVAYSNSNSLIDFNFTSSEAKATFTASTDVADLHTGDVAAFNTDKKTITFVGKNAITYAGKTGYTYKYFGGNGAQLANADSFIEELKNAKGNVRVTYKLDSDNLVTFSIVRLDATGTPPEDTFAKGDVVGAAKKALLDAAAAGKTLVDAAVEGTNPGEYSATAIALYKAAIATAEAEAAKAGATEASLKAATATLATATATFKAAVNPEAPNADGFTFTSKTAEVNKVIAQAATYDIAGTVAEKVGDVASVVVAFGTTNLKEVPATYNASTRAFEFKGNGSTQDTVIVIAKDAAGKELSKETITIDFK